MQVGYPPPQAVGAPFRATPMHPSGIDVSGHKPGARMWVLIGGLATALLMPVGFVVFVIGIAVQDKQLTPMLVVAAYATMMLASVFMYVRFGFALFWLYQAWKWIPLQQRHDKNGRPRTPSETFYLLIPYFGLYWMFVYNFALCDALDRMRVQYRTTRPAPRELAMWACICELIPFVNLFAPPFLWASAMKRIDQMHEEILSQA